MAWTKILNDWCWDAWEDRYGGKPWIYWDVWYREDTDKRTSTSATYEFKVKVWLQYTQSWIGIGTKSDPKAVKFKIELGDNSDTIVFKTDDQEWRPASDRHMTTKFSKPIKLVTKKDGGTITCKVTAFGQYRPNMSKKITIKLSAQPYKDPAAFKITKTTPHLSNSDVTSVVEKAATIYWSKSAKTSDAGTLRYRLRRNNETVKSDINALSYEVKPPSSRGSTDKYKIRAYIKESGSHYTDTSNKAYIRKASLPTAIKSFSVAANLYNTYNTSDESRKITMTDSSYFSDKVSFTALWTLNGSVIDPDSKPVKYEIQYKASTSNGDTGWISCKTIDITTIQSQQQYSVTIDPLSTLSYLVQGDKLVFRIRPTKVTDDKVTVANNWVASNTLLRASTLDNYRPVIVAPRIDMQSQDGLGVSYSKSGYLSSITLLPTYDNYVGQSMMQIVDTFSYKSEVDPSTYPEYYHTNYLDTYRCPNRDLYDQGSYTSNGVTFTLNEDMTITANGTATQEGAVCLIGDVLCPDDLWDPEFTPYTIEEGEVIKFTCTPAGGSMDTYYSSIESVEGSVAYDIGDRVSYTKSWYDNILIHIATGYTADNLVFKPLVTKSTDKNMTYIPTQTSEYDGPSLSGESVVVSDLVARELSTPSFLMVTNSQKVQIFPTQVTITTKVYNAYGDESLTDTVIATQHDPDILSLVDRGDIITNEDYETTASVAMDVYKSYQLVNSIGSRKSELTLASSIVEGLPICSIKISHLNTSLLMYISTYANTDKYPSRKSDWLYYRMYSSDSIIPMTSRIYRIVGTFDDAGYDTSAGEGAKLLNTYYRWNASSRTYDEYVSDNSSYEVVDPMLTMMHQLGLVIGQETGTALVSQEEKYNLDTGDIITASQYNQLVNLIRRF